MTSELKRYWIGNDEGTGFPVSDDEEGEWVKFTDAEAALADRDKRIKELEAIVEEMKCCGNCGLNDCLRYEMCEHCTVDGREKWRMK